MGKIENIGGVLVAVGAGVFLASYLVPQAKQWKSWAEYGVIGGAALWVLGKVA